MTDKKLTDLEIVKALECCCGGLTSDWCDKCPMNVTKECDKDLLALEKLALNLINRLQEENDRLINDIAISKKETKRYVQGYKMACTERNEFLEQLATAKAEAYKECLDKIEQRDVSESDFYIMVKKTEFNNLLKELVGEDNGSN